MENKTIESLRWQDWPARIAIVSNNGGGRVFYQVTGPNHLEKICKGRPAEELPRITSILSSAHHLVSAMALDRLFNVDPPPLARNMRKALLQTQFLAGHLRKLYFLLASFANPFQDFSRHSQKKSIVVPSSLLEEIMRHVALAQEAGTILGGRSEHPLIALPGGVSRFIKEEYYPRLGEIAERCVVFSQKLSEFALENLFGDSAILADYSNIAAPSMASACIKGECLDDPENPSEGEVAITDGSGKESDLFSADKILEKIGTHQEPWTRMPFAFLSQTGWKGVLNGDATEGLFFVGPLARLNAGKTLSTPLAEELRQKTLQSMEALPRFDAAAAFKAMVIETLHAAEILVALGRKEALTGPKTRNIPTEIGTEGHAALESPGGLIFHHYRVNADGLIKQTRILDTSAQNNAIKCLMAQKAFDDALVRKHTFNKTRHKIEVSLLPF